MSMSTSPEYLDLGADIERRQQTPWTPRDMDALRQQADATMDREAEHLNWWLSLGDDWGFPEWGAIATQLHKAYPRSTVRHPLHDVAVSIVERMAALELEELINAD